MRPCLRVELQSEAKSSILPEVYRDRRVRNGGGGVCSGDHCCSCIGFRFRPTGTFLMADGLCNNPSTNEELKPSLFLFCEEAHASVGGCPNAFAHSPLSPTAWPPPSFILRPRHRWCRHPLMTKLHGIKSSNPVLAQMIAEQVFDNTLVAAGLMDDSRIMLPRC